MKYTLEFHIPAQTMSLELTAGEYEQYEKMTVAEFREAGNALLPAMKDFYDTKIAGPFLEVHK